MTDPIELGNASPDTVKRYQNRVAAAGPRPITQPQPQPVARPAPAPAKAPVRAPILSADTTAELKQALQAGAEQAQAQIEAAPAAAEKADEGEQEKLNNLLDEIRMSRLPEHVRISNNPARRTAIEAKLEPMRLADLVLRDEVQQLVPVVEGLEIVFRSATERELLFVKQFVTSEEMAAKGSEYQNEMFGLCQLALSLVALNGVRFPDHRDADGEVDRKAFAKKLQMISRKSSYLIAEMALQWNWFDLRVRKLYSEVTEDSLRKS